MGRLERGTKSVHVDVGLQRNGTGDARQCPISKTCEYDLERLPGSSVRKFNVTVKFITGTSDSFVYRVLPKKTLKQGGQGAKE